MLRKRERERKLGQLSFGGGIKNHIIKNWRVSLEEKSGGDSGTRPTRMPRHLLPTVKRVKQHLKWIGKDQTVKIQLTPWH